MELRTILIDDLVKHVSFKKAVVKIDIEGKEGIAMQNPTELFKRLDICYLFIESERIPYFHCKDLVIEHI